MVPIAFPSQYTPGLPREALRLPFSQPLVNEMVPFVHQKCLGGLLGLRESSTGGHILTWDEGSWGIAETSEAWGAGPGWG